jgi:hypothetical protein
MVYYVRQNKKERWDELSDEEKKDLTKRPARRFVELKKIEKIDGDKYFFKDKKGNDFSKTKEDIVGKDSKETEQEVEENVVYKFDEF